MHSIMSQNIVNRLEIRDIIKVIKYISIYGKNTNNICDWSRSVIEGINGKRFVLTISRLQINTLYL